MQMNMANKTKRCNSSNTKKVSVNDDVVERVISFLPIQRAIEFSLLSTRFVHSWRQNRVFTFGKDFARERTSEEMALILTRVFGSHLGTKIQRFSLYLDPLNLDYVLMRHWIEEAIRKGVQILDLDFSKGNPNQFLKLDFSNRNIESLNILKLHYCSLNFPIQLQSFRNLKHVDFRKVVIHHLTLIGLFSCCLKLETLELWGCFTTEHLSFSVQNLKYFKVLKVDNCKYFTSIDIYAESLCSLYFRGEFCTINIQTSLPELDDVVLDFKPHKGFENVSQVKQLILRLPRVKALKVSHTFLEEVETRVEQAGTPNKGVKKGRSSKKLIKWWETGQEEENVHVEGEDSAILLGKQQINEGVNVDADGYIRHEYPLRLDAENCAHYMRTGTCKYGLSCRFNHPMRRRRSQGTKDTSKQREEDVDKLWQVECKYYLTPGGCKHGSACRYSHSKGTTAAVPNVDLNFLGLPLRTGEKDCPYYMDTGSCKFGQNCRFNHPDRRLKGEGQPHSRPVNLQEMTSSWRPSAGSFNETVGAPPKVVREEYQGPIYTPSQLSLSLPPAMSHQSSNASFYLQHQQELLVEDFAEENEQAEAQNRVVPPMYTPLPRSLFLPAAMSPAASDFYLQLQQEMLVEEFQEQTGQPEPPYPRSRSPIDRSCALNEKGLPLRPGKDVCAYYNRYRLCKYGPACRFDHPGDVQSAR